MAVKKNDELQEKPSWVSQIEAVRESKGMNTANYDAENDRFVSDSYTPVSSPYIDYGSDSINKTFLDRVSSGGSSGSSSGTSSAGFNASKYTPIGAGSDYYMNAVGMSASDQAALKAAGDAYNSAATDADRAAAHAAAEAIRAKYGYSGGVDGSDYIGGIIPLQPQAPQYTSRYQDTLDSILGEWLNRDPFSYDPNTDPLYQAMQNMYTREGNRAMMNTLGQAAGRTGGLASSYAVSAANQANNYFLTQLGDKIPELQQLAYDMYLGDAQAQAQQIQMLQSLEKDNYNRFLTDLDQYNTDREFNYGVGRDQINDSRYDDELAWDRNQYTSELEYEKALEKAETLAAAGDFSGYRELGYTDTQISMLKAAYDAQNAAKSGGGYRGSGGGGDQPAEQDYEGLFAAASKEMSPQNYISSNYKKYGFTSSSGLSSAYENWAKENTYKESDIGNVAKGLLTDLRKYYASQQDQEDKAYKEYESGGISWQEYLWLSDQLGFGG